MRQPSFGSLLIVALSGLFVANQSFGQTYHLDTNLDGLQEVPPNASPAFGSADLTLNAATGLVSIDASTGTYSDLLGNSTVIRLADAATGANGPTQFLLTLDNIGSTSGTFSGSGTLTPAAITDMIAGNTYLNIASNVFPSGEIRGQITVVPEPASLSILTGITLLAIRRRPRNT
jgi:CHRD domain